MALRETAEKHLKVLKLIHRELEKNEEWEDLTKEIEDLIAELEHELSQGYGLSKRSVELLSLAASIISILLGFS
ncbi:hypothetical protein [Pseudoroseicyclus tamaricis]|uniref:Uncharacterized protein n=1 Tax=Pseudoroseicyclus tamaricis TaxID=2705421 RepID=A0A6B2JLK5_9RHOB|nr:hypothetical protein [Pseudoroseicyclus tamaricis]NDV02441.1 hypothetical protein [Pseudoroseicyclus tamaricis]